MEAKLQLRIQRYGWDKAAVCYDTGWQQQLSPAQKLLLEMAQLSAGEQVLDVACGTGLVTFPAAQSVGSGGQVVATDLSDIMLNHMREKAARDSIQHIKAYQMNAEELEFTSEKFDAALCGLGMMYVPDPVKAFQEMYRVLKPGGRAVSAVWGQRQQCGWAQIFPIIDARVNTDVCPLFFNLGTGDMQAMLMEKAGFRKVQSERIAANLHYPTAEAAISAIFAGGPVALAYAKFDGPTRVEAHAEYLSSIEAYRKGSSYDIPGEFVVTKGWK